MTFGIWIWYIGMFYINSVSFMDFADVFDKLRLFKQKSTMTLWRGIWHFSERVNKWHLAYEYDVCGCLTSILWVSRNLLTNSRSCVCLSRKEPWHFDVRYDILRKEWINDIWHMNMMYRYVLHQFCEFHEICWRIR